MTIEALKTIVTKATVSDQFRAGMLGGKRTELLKDFELSPDELADVMAIRAATETDFYQAMGEIITRRSATQSGQKP